MTDKEINELNDFVGANPIRNKFLPLLQKITSLPNNNLMVEEYHTDPVTKETSSIQYTFLPKVIPPKGKDYDEEYDNPMIAGDVRYDWTVQDGNPVAIPGKVIFNFWWGGENYCLLQTVEEALLVATSLYNGEKFYNELKALRKLRNAEWQEKQKSL